MTAHIILPSQHTSNRISNIHWTFSNKTAAFLGGAFLIATYFFVAGFFVTAAGFFLQYSVMGTVP